MIYTYFPYNTFHTHKEKRKNRKNKSRRKTYMAHIFFTTSIYSMTEKNKNVQILQKKIIFFYNQSY